MRVTHIITRLVVGGAQENTLSTVAGLRRLGFDADLVAGPAGGPEGSLESEATGFLEIEPRLVRPVSPWNDFLALRSLTGRFRTYRPDIVHTHSGKAGILGRLAAHAAGTPAVVHTIHGPSFGGFQGPVANGVFRAAERWAGKHTDHFVVVADAMTRQYLAAGIGRPEQYTRVFSGFDLAPFLNARFDAGLARRLGIEPGDFVIGTIARLFDLKGHHDLLAAAPSILAQIPRARFLWVGDGALKAALQARAREVGLEGRVLFAGLIPPAAVAAHIGLMDCVAHLSRREGLPRALPQALAAGKPVVAYDADGAPEVCRDGETGFLAKTGDWAAVAAGIVKLAASPELRRQLGENGRKWVAARFRTEDLVAGQAAVYRKLSDRAGSPPPRLAP